MKENIISDQGFSLKTHDDEQGVSISLLRILGIVPYFLFLFFVYWVLIVRKNPNIQKFWEKKFSGENSFWIWGNITTKVEKRPMSSLGFNETYEYIWNSLVFILNDYKGEHNITVLEQNEAPLWSEFASINQNMRDCRNILFYFGEKNSTIDPLIISAHIDSKNTGQGAYDDAAGIAAMLELASLLTRKMTPPPTPILLAFIGTEELGLHGSKALVKSNVRASGYFNIESIGTGLPLVLLQRGNGSSEIVKSWCTKWGMPVAMMINDLLKLGIITSSSDSVIYKGHGIPGAEAIFMGNPTMYHTKLDSIGPPEHIQYLGNALESLIYSFNGKAKSYDSVAIGISPLVIHLSTTMSRIVSLIVSISSLLIAIIILFNEEKLKSK